jgi:hypothetical protein
MLAIPNNIIITKFMHGPSSENLRIFIVYCAYIYHKQMPPQ